MDSTLTDTIDDCARASYAGTASFGQIVGTLAAAGIEAYSVDYRGATAAYYLPDGRAHVIGLKKPAVDIPIVFDKAALQAAIKGSQRGEVKYPEFLQLSMQAGCVGYTVWIAGRHVAYFGRRGDQHIERFPD